MMQRLPSTSSAVSSAFPAPQQQRDGASPGHHSEGEGGDTDGHPNPSDYYYDEEDVPAELTQEEVEALRERNVSSIEGRQRAAEASRYAHTVDRDTKIRAEMLEKELQNNHPLFRLIQKQEVKEQKTRAEAARKEEAHRDQTAKLKQMLEESNKMAWLVNAVKAAEDAERRLLEREEAKAFSGGYYQPSSSSSPSMLLTTSKGSPLGNPSSAAGGSSGSGAIISRFNDPDLALGIDHDDHPFRILSAIPSLPSAADQKSLLCPPNTLLGRLQRFYADLGRQRVLAEQSKLLARTMDGYAQLKVDATMREGGGVGNSGTPTTTATATTVGAPNQLTASGVIGGLSFGAVNTMSSGAANASTTIGGGPHQQQHRPSDGLCSIRPIPLVQHNSDGAIGTTSAANSRTNTPRPLSVAMLSATNGASSHSRLRAPFASSAAAASPLDIRSFMAKEMMRAETAAAAGRFNNTSNNNNNKSGTTATRRVSSAGSSGAAGRPLLGPDPARHGSALARFTTDAVRALVKAHGDVPTPATRAEEDGDGASSATRVSSVNNPAFASTSVMLLAPTPTEAKSRLGGQGSRVTLAGRLRPSAFDALHDDYDQSRQQQQDQQQYRSGGGAHPPPSTGVYKNVTLHNKSANSNANQFGPVATNTSSASTGRGGNAANRSAVLSVGVPPAPSPIASVISPLTDLPTPTPKPIPSAALFASPTRGNKYHQSDAVTTAAVASASLSLRDANLTGALGFAATGGNNGLNANNAGGGGILSIGRGDSDNNAGYRRGSAASTITGGGGGGSSVGGNSSFGNFGGGHNIVLGRSNNTTATNGGPQMVSSNRRRTSPIASAAHGVGLIDAFSSSGISPAAALFGGHANNSASAKARRQSSIAAAAASLSPSSTSAAAGINKYSNGGSSGAGRRRSGGGGKRASFIDADGFSSTAADEQQQSHHQEVELSRRTTPPPPNLSVSELSFRRPTSPPNEHLRRLYDAAARVQQLNKRPPPTTTTAVVNTSSHNTARTGGSIRGVGGGGSAMINRSAANSNPYTNAGRASAGNNVSSVTTLRQPTATANASAVSRYSTASSNGSGSGRGGGSGGVRASSVSSTGPQRGPSPPPSHQPQRGGSGRPSQQRATVVATVCALPYETLMAEMKASAGQR